RLRDCRRRDCPAVQKTKACRFPLALRRTDDMVRRVPMADAFASKAGDVCRGAVLCLLFTFPAIAPATDWPQYRGPNSDGISPDLISVNWQSNGPTVVWTNMTLTNGFRSFTVSQGRAF